jgi:hypothetical protein
MNIRDIIRMGNLDQVKEWLNSGSDINEQDNDGCMPIFSNTNQ